MRCQQSPLAFFWFPSAEPTDRGTDLPASVRRGTGGTGWALHPPRVSSQCPRSLSNLQGLGWGRWLEAIKPQWPGELGDFSEGRDRGFCAIRRHQLLPVVADEHQTQAAMALGGRASRQSCHEGFACYACQECGSGKLFDVAACAGLAASEWDASTRAMPSSPFFPSLQPSPAFCRVVREQAPLQGCVPSSTWEMRDLSPSLSQGSRAEAEIAFGSGGQALLLRCWEVREQLSCRLLAGMSFSVPARSRSLNCVGSCWEDKNNLLCLKLKEVSCHLQMF